METDGCSGAVVSYGFTWYITFIFLGLIMWLGVVDDGCDKLWQYGGFCLCCFTCCWSLYLLVVFLDLRTSAVNDRGEMATGRGRFEPLPFPATEPPAKRRRGHSTVSQSINVPMIVLA